MVALFPCLHQSVTVLWTLGKGLEVGSKHPKLAFNDLGRRHFCTLGPLYPERVAHFLVLLYIGRILHKRCSELYKFAHPFADWLAEMLRLNAVNAYRRPACRLLFSYGGPQPVLVDTDGTHRQVLYTGPMNSLVSRAKVTSLISAGTSILAAPLIIRAAAGGQLWATSGILGRYVVHAYQLKSSSGSEDNIPLQDQLIELESYDWTGRLRRRAFFIRDLYMSNTGELTSRSSGDRYTFCPHICQQSPILNEIMMSKK
ncbi:hypothetical protein PSACC_03347 [Paramicrosporidium saccamoebae]|uniref:Uncharacterized protein n=1 Tax=Paramicrosporidium saccamoebae TaxID=1246581 RepID=A0A2H9TGF3_9FUNG|nr:hypothetical protein PSACC_03347 [Paramicrosporidium saccamoebae]